MDMLTIVVLAAIFAAWLTVRLFEWYVRRGVSKLRDEEPGYAPYARGPMPSYDPTPPDEYQRPRRSKPRASKVYITQHHPTYIDRQTVYKVYHTHTQED
jgi:peptidoglycan/LPS O-acetylase OafA/YrhL